MKEPQVPTSRKYRLKQIVSTGDFDGDGKADILWRNSSSGLNAIWLMNGTNSTAQAFITTVVDTKWRVVGVLQP